MSCNADYYRAKEQVIRETWGKDILDGKVENVDLWFFTGGEKNKIDEENHIIYVKVNDSRYHTFQKFCKTVLEIIDNVDLFKFDYLVRVNISTYVNVPALRCVINHQTDVLDILVGTIFVQPWVCNHLPFLSGEMFLFSLAHLKIILTYYLKNKNVFDSSEVGEYENSTELLCDDGWVTKIFADIYGTAYLKKINAFGLWYEPYKDIHFQDRYKDFIAISYKSDDMYDTIATDKNPINNDIDIEKCHKIHQVFEDLKCEYGDEWYEHWEKDIKNKFCRSSLHRRENAYCDLKFVKWCFFKWWKENVELLTFASKSDPEKEFGFE